MFKPIEKEKQWKVTKLLLSTREEEANLLNKSTNLRGKFLGLTSLSTSAGVIMTNDESSKNENGRKENPESPSAQQLVAIDYHQNTHLEISVNLLDENKKI